VYVIAVLKLFVSLYVCIVQFIYDTLLFYQQTFSYKLSSYCAEMAKPSITQLMLA